jgi:hypothetical protein
MNEESKTELQKLLMQMYEKGANDAEAALKEAMEYGIDIAIKAEREACAKLCEDQIKSYMSKQYTTDPLGGYRERFASEQCAAAIRGRTE